jgi:eukaryotic-like serine/threonine-protein kinase
MRRRRCRACSGVLHLDLKPDNVLLERTGRVVVSDFGISRAANERGRTLSIVGTPAYMAPEQVEDGDDLDHRVDVYAIGAILYEMLTGRPAWEGESMWKVAAARLLRPPPDPVGLRIDCPVELSAIVLRCMARDRSVRPASAHAIAAALRDAGVPESLLGPPVVVSGRPQTGLESTGSDTRVAVLPFRLLGPSERGYVADGVTEDLIDALSVVRGLRVRSRGMVAEYRDESRDPRTVGRELDVHVVVEGSLRPIPGGFRVQARLVSVADGLQLWARRFDVAEAALLVQNDAIAAAVAEALTVDFHPSRRAAADGRAVDLYLRARHAYHQAFSRTAAESLRLYVEVLALTPDDPRALAGRALAGAQHWPSTEIDRQVAREASDRAVLLAPMLPDAHVARGVVRYMEGDFVGAVLPLRRALRLSPANGEAHEVLGRLLLEIDCDDGRAHLEQTLALEPTFEFPYVSLAAYHEMRGEQERVEELLDGAQLRSRILRVQVESRLLLWRRDERRAAELLAELGEEVPPVVRGWLELIVSKQPTASIALDPARAPQFFRRFLLQSEIEQACFLDDRQGALALLDRLDAEGSADVAWLGAAPCSQICARNREPRRFSHAWPRGPIS